MNTRFYTLLIALVTFLTFAFTSDDEQTTTTCDALNIKNKAKETLKPIYSYDASKTTHLVFGSKMQFKELEVPLYVGEKYRFIFSMEGLPQNVDIEVYDKKYESKDRKLLFSSKESQKVNDQYVFDPEKSYRKLYIDYHVPPAEGAEAKGCLILTLGYKIK